MATEYLIRVDQRVYFVGANTEVLTEARCKGDNWFYKGIFTNAEKEKVLTGPMFSRSIYLY